MEIAIGVAIAVVVVLVIVIAAAVRIVAEYERGVIFRLGRLMGARGPGLFLIIPIIERMVRVDLRIITMDIPSQEVITRDNVTIRVNAVLYFKIVDANQAVTAVLDYIRATSQIAQTTMRNVVGQSLLDELLSEREDINQRLQRIIDEQTEPWGVKVTIVEIKDVELPTTMQRAMARQAEAERERRSKIIAAEGEKQASETLADAGRVLAAVPTTMQLRFLQTLSEIATEKNSTIVLPVPIDLLTAFIPGVRQAVPPSPSPPASSEIADLQTGMGGIAEDEPPSGPTEAL
ncbi:MAG TPA: slipin family protein [Dehalococcoidia bacterium]|nr:slipin family protein [Dehalococcoidia bacterium]